MATNNFIIVKPDSKLIYDQQEPMNPSINSDLYVDKTELLDTDNKVCKPSPIFVFGLIACFVGFIGLFCGVYFGMGFNQAPIPTTKSMVTQTTLPVSSQQFIGQSCTLSTQCMPSSYCDSATAVCTCSPSLYYESLTGTCKTRKSYGESCSTSTECEFNQLLTCSGSICKCDSMLFWNSVTNMCEDKRGLGESCVGATNECYASKMVCAEVNGSVLNRCICPLTTMYFSFYTGDCEYRKIHGTQCYSNSHFECVEYAYCTTWPGDATYRCTCWYIFVI
jgi:hypothetical protein